MKKKNNKLKEGMFITRIAIQAIKPEWIVKTHGGFMPDGTPMDDIKSVDDFWTHALHTEGKEISNLAFSIVEDLNKDGK